MVRCGIFALVCGVLLLPAGRAAAEGWTAIGAQDGAVEFRMAWADIGNSSHATRWTPDYAIQLFISEWWSGSDRFPRTGILVQRLAPFHYWNQPDAIGKRDVELWRSLKDRSPRDFRAQPCGALHCTAFAIDGSRCVAFLYPTAPLGSRRTGDDGGDLVSGYYCSGTPAPIETETIDAVIDAIKVRRPPPAPVGAPPADT